MPRPIQHDDRQVVHPLAFRGSQRFDVLLDAHFERAHAAPSGADGQLLHVDDARRVVHRAALGNGDHRDGIRQALGEQRRAIDRIDRQVDFWRLSVTDALADIEHRRLVLLTLADDHDAIHRNRPETVAHGVDRGLVERVLVAATHPARRGQRGCLSHPAQLEGDVAIKSAARSELGACDVFRRQGHGDRRLLGIEVV